MRITTSLAVTITLAHAMSLVAVAQTEGAPTFTDITGTTGVALPDTLTESVAWGDYDNDGDEDLYLTSDGPNNLFRNNGDGTFSDVTGIAGVGATGFSVGTAFGDLDNDGDLDLYVVSFGSGPDVLYRNDGPTGPGGTHVFTDVTMTAGTTDETSSRGVALLDYDHDGLLDVYVNAIGPDILYRNLGNLTFTNVATALGVATEGQGVGAVATDLDGNGWIDLFTGNRSNNLNRLYTNAAATFSDRTVAAGIDKIGLGMGVLSFDYDNDLDFDLYWTTWPGSVMTPTPNALYENQGLSRSARGGLSFVDVAVASGTTDPNGWGISCNAGDVDNDGWQDFFITNGFDASTSPNVLFHNQADGTFDDATASLEGGANFDGRGVAFADFDNDGDVDLVVTGGLADDTRFWRNDTVSGHHWFRVHAVGTTSNRSAIGAHITATTNLRTTVKEVSGGAGRGSFNSLPVELGLGDATELCDVVARWPGGGISTRVGDEMDRAVTISQNTLLAASFESGGLCGWDQPVP